MKVVPFESVGEVKFSDSRKDIIAALGKPDQEVGNCIGLHELKYQNIIYRFDKAGALEEITVHAPVLDLGAVSVPFSVLSAYIHQQDHSAFTKAGFLVSPQFGLAFDPDCPPWVTVITKHSIDLWRAVQA